MELRCNHVIQMTATGPDLRCNEASGCRGGQRGFGGRANGAKKKKKTKRFKGGGGMNLLPCGGAHIQRAMSPGGGGVQGVQERGREIRQVGL